MNWRTPLCQAIVADKRFSREQRDVAVLWVGELSALCDAMVPGAPPPHIERIIHEDNVLALSWLWRDRGRSLTIYVERDQSVWVQLLDAGLANTDTRPTHTTLKRYVHVFFEGWDPSHVTL